MCLRERQTDHVYKAIEEGNMINTKTVTCESMHVIQPKFRMTIRTRK